MVRLSPYCLVSRSSPVLVIYFNSPVYDITDLAELRIGAVRLPNKKKTYNIRRNFREWDDITSKPNDTHKLYKIKNYFVKNFILINLLV